MYHWLSKFKKISKFFIKNEIKKRDIFKNIQVETFGNLNLTLENELELNILCKADRIDNSNTEIIIYDYKTSLMRKVDLMNFSPQLDKKYDRRNLLKRHSCSRSFLVYQISLHSKTKEWRRRLHQQVTDEFLQNFPLSNLRKCNLLTSL